jgi:hypothetical protein
VWITDILDKLLLIFELIILFFDISDGLIYGSSPDLLGLDDLLHAEYRGEILLDLVNLNELIPKHLIPHIKARDHGLLVEHVLEVFLVVLL